MPSPQTKAAAAELQRRRLLRRDFGHFMRWVFSVVDPGTELKWAWYLDALCEHAMYLHQGDIKNLIINIPPRMLKSIVFSVGLPAWIIGKKPTEQFLCASGSGNLATNLSMNCRLIVTHPYYKKLFPKVELTRDQDTKQFFKTTQQGHRLAVSTGSKVIGFGGNWEIMDDPNQAEDAFSPDELEKANRWWDLVFSTRVNDPETARRICIQQRLATNDMTAHLEEEGGWEKLVLPRLFELRTTYVLPISEKKIIVKAGETIHPERVSLERVEKMKSKEFEFASQQQQRPTALGGNRIKENWFGEYTARPVEFDEIIQSWDTASSGKEINNESVCHTYGRVGGKWYLIDRYGESITWSKLKRKGPELAAAHKPNLIIIENKASGIQLIDEMTSGTEGKRIWPVKKIEPRGTKDQRMDMELESAGLEAGIISLPAGNNPPPWLHNLKLRLAEFPNPIAWDDIDAMSQFLKHIREREGNSVDLW